MDKPDKIPGASGPTVEPGATGLHPMIEVKLWGNPCWLAYRLNYLALRYNVPLYGWVEERYGLTRPEFVVLYSLGLQDDGLARDISVSSGFPKNTLSRAISKLCAARLIERSEDPSDKRSQILRLSPEGRRIFDEALPYFVDFEKRMLATLSPDERDTLSRLMAKIVLDSVNWPTEIEMPEKNAVPDRDAAD